MKGKDNGWISIYDRRYNEERNESSFHLSRKGEENTTPIQEKMQDHHQIPIAINI